jgi:hypothetical protein
LIPNRKSDAIATQFLPTIAGAGGEAEGMTKSDDEKKKEKTETARDERGTNAIEARRVSAFGKRGQRRVRGLVAGGRRSVRDAEGFADGLALEKPPAPSHTLRGAERRRSC